MALFTLRVAPPPRCIKVTNSISKTYHCCRGSRRAVSTPKATVTAAAAKMRKRSQLFLLAVWIEMLMLFTTAVSAPSVAVFAPPMGRPLGGLCRGVGVGIAPGDAGDRIDSVGPQGCSQPIGLALQASHSSVPFSLLSLQGRGRAEGNIQGGSTTRRRQEGQEEINYTIDRLPKAARFSTGGR